MTPLMVTAPARIRPSRGIVATSRCHWFVRGSYMSTDFSLSTVSFQQTSTLKTSGHKSHSCVESVGARVVGRVQFVIGAGASADDIQLARDNHGRVRRTPLPKTAATPSEFPTR